MKINLNYNWNDETGTLFKASGNVTTSTSKVGVFETDFLTINFNNEIETETEISIKMVVFKHNSNNYSKLVLNNV